MYVSCAIISTVQSTSANQIDVAPSSEDKSKALVKPYSCGSVLFNSFSIIAYESCFVNAETAKTIGENYSNFVPELCKWCDIS